LKSRNSAPNSKKEAKPTQKGKEARKWDDQYEEVNAKNIDFYDKYNKYSFVFIFKRKLKSNFNKILILNNKSLS